MSFSEMDIVGSVGVRVVPIIDAQDVQQAVEQAAQQASGARVGAANARSSVAASHAAIASAPHLTPAAPAIPQGVESMYSRQAIASRLYGELRPEIDQINGIYEQQLGQFAQGQSFPGALPGEMRRALQGNPARARMMRLLSTNVPGGQAEDVAGAMGGWDQYVRALEYQAGSPFGHAIEAASRYGAPPQQLMAGLAAAQPGRGNALPAMEHISAAALQAGTRFSIAGYAHSVVEPDEGVRMLRGPLAKRDLPLDAFGQIPADVGSLRLPAPADFSNFEQGAPAAPRRFSLDQLNARAMDFVKNLRPGWLGLPSPDAATEFPGVTGPMGVGERTYIGDRPDAEARERTQRRGRPRQNAFDPTKLAQLIEHYEREARDPENSRQSRDFLRGAAQGMRDQMKGAGYDFDSYRSDRPPVIPPPPGGETAAAAGGDDEPNRPSLRMGDFSRGEYSGRRPERVNATRARTRAARTAPASTAADNFADFLEGSDSGSRRGRAGGTILGDVGRWAAGKAAGPLLRRTSIRNQFRARRIGTALRKLGGRSVISHGNFMSALFGGAEVIGALQSTATASAKAALSTDGAEQAHDLLTGFQSGSGGFLGRFAAFAIDPTGSIQSGIQTMLGRSRLQDAASDAQRSLMGMNRAASSPLTSVGQAVRSLTTDVRDRQATVAAELAKIRDEGVVASQVAGDAVRNKNWWLYPYETAAQKDEALDAGLKASRSYEGRYRSIQAKQRSADADAVNVMVGDFIRGNRNAAEDSRIDTANVGNPTGAARAHLMAQQARERADFANPLYRKEFIDASVQAGLTPTQAGGRFNAVANSLGEQQQAARDAFEATVAFQQGRRRSLLRARRIGGIPGQITEQAEQDAQDANDPALAAEIRGAAARSIQYDRDTRRNAIDSATRTQQLLNQSRPYDAQRQQLRDSVTAQRRSLMESDPNEYWRGGGKQRLDDYEAAGIAGINKNEQQVGRGIAIEQDTQINVLTATIASGQGRASFYAPRAASIVGGYRSQRNAARDAGRPQSEIDRIGQIAGLQMDADQAEFFGQFRAVQHDSLDEVDTSGREFDHVIGDFRRGRNNLNAAINEGPVSVGNCVDRAVQSMTLRLQQRYYRASLDQLEEATA